MAYDKNGEFAGLTLADIERIRSMDAVGLDINEVHALCDNLLDCMKALNRVCRHDDPDNSGRCIKCRVTLDPDGPPLAEL